MAEKEAKKNRSNKKGLMDIVKGKIKKNEGTQSSLTEVVDKKKREKLEKLNGIALLLAHG